MKIYISVDMEGITGVNTGKQCAPGEPDYNRFRKLMTADVNAAIEGALSAGATEFVVNDSHGPMTNVLIEELHPKARLLSGSNKHLAQMEGLDGSFAGVFFVGYHAREGRDDAVVNHTLLGRAVYEIRVNGQPVDEAALNAGIAGAVGVPVALVTGDDVVTADARARFPGVATAAVKRAVDRFTAESLGVQESQALIRDQAREAVERLKAGRLGLHDPGRPYRFEVDFKSTACAHMCTLFPQVERVGGRTIAVIDDDYLRGFRQLWGCLIIALGTMNGLL